ncbi:MAG: hypothetical protein AAFV53_43025 [Myxococcota bacterium]
MSDGEVQPQGCELCGRKRRLTFHHLIPVKLHANRWFRKRFSRDEMKHRGAMLCRDCHNAVHRFIDHKSLGREWNTVERLKTHPELSRFIDWVRTQRRHRSRMA